MAAGDWIEARNAKMALVDTLEYGVFLNKALLNKSNVETGKVLDVSPKTVGRRLKTPTYERLRELAVQKLNDEFNGDIIQEWAKLVHKLANAKKKTEDDLTSIMAAVGMITNVCGLSAPKVDKVEHSVKMLDTDALEAAIIETADGYIESDFALPSSEEADDICPQDDREGFELDQEQL